MEGIKFVPWFRPIFLLSFPFPTSSFKSPRSPNLPSDSWGHKSAPVGIAHRQRLHQRDRNGSLWRKGGGCQAQGGASNSSMTISISRWYDCIGRRNHKKTETIYIVTIEPEQRWNRWNENKGHFTWTWHLCISSKWQIAMAHQYHTSASISTWLEQAVRLHFIAISSCGVGLSTLFRSHKGGKKWGVAKTYGAARKKHVC